VTDPRPPERDRHWPRDAPIRWGAFARGLGFQGVAIVAVAAQLVLGALAVLAILGPQVEGVGEWLLAVAWGAGALWLFRAWMFHDGSIVVPPVVAAVLLVVLGGV